MALYDSRIYQQALEELDEKTQRIDPAPTKNQKLGRFTIAALIFNRTIGSGIFVSQKFVLRGTGDSVGTSLVLWAVGGIVALCGALVWLEFGLSIPRHVIQGRKRAVPRNGGEKNFLEYFYQKPELLATCIYGIAFVVVGNLAGNAYAFGRYIMRAAGRSPEEKGPVIGIAIAVLTAVVLVHTCTRKGGIILNNFLAIFKVLFLVCIIILAIVKTTGTGENLSHYNASVDQNFGSSAFESAATGATGVAEALFYVLYAYSGFEQPFYVLTEFAAPRKRFTRYVVGSQIVVMILFVAVNAAYSLVVPRDYETNPPRGTMKGEDISIVFFTMVFGNETVTRAMSAFIAVSIFGGLVVMTFTAARVKQEIAKEGILPFSLFWSTSKDSPGATLAAWWRRNVMRKPDPYFYGDEDPENHREKVPIAALFLHWLFSVLLVAVTARLSTGVAYQVLVNLYVYVKRVLIGLFVGVALFLLKVVPKWRWSEKTHYRGVNKWLGLIPVTIYTLFTAFLVVVPFIPPEDPSTQTYSHFIVPSIGISFLLWGTLWWLAMKLFMRATHQRLDVTRRTFVKLDPDVDDSYLQVAEVVTHQWPSTIDYDKSDSENGQIEQVQIQQPKYSGLLPSM